MSRKIETTTPTTPEDVEEALKETRRLYDLHERLKKMQEAKALGLPYQTLN